MSVTVTITRTKRCRTCRAPFDPWAGQHDQYDPRFAVRTLCTPCCDDPHRPDTDWTPKGAQVRLLAVWAKIEREANR